jgi:hypothetical protein
VTDIADMLAMLFARTGGASALSRVKADGECVFSVCTLVTDVTEYEKTLRSFLAKGFNLGNSEFLVVDNRNANRLDAFAGIREFVESASGCYIVVCHQDVELIEDGFDVLLQRLRELGGSAPNWAVAGNVGVRGLTNWIARISDPHIRDARVGYFPAAVDSIDENFIVIRRETGLLPSNDLSGFHFYGLDLCIQAERRGLGAYVIDFHLLHKSAGCKSAAYFASRGAIENKYAQGSRGRIVRTPCEYVFLGWMSRLRALRWSLGKIIWLAGRANPILNAPPRATQTRKT